MREIVAALELLNYDALGVFRRFNVVNGFVKIGVERMAGVGDNIFQTELRQRASKLGMNLTQTFEQCGIGLRLGLGRAASRFFSVRNGSFQVIEHR